jgi:hypothetical protein
MKKLIFCFCSLILLVSNNSFASEKKEKIPECKIGSALAVDPNRELAHGEEITTETGGVVVISLRESIGSRNIIFHRCILSDGEPVVIGGQVPWVKKCGNALIQTEGWSLPLAESQKIRGPKGDKGDPGINGTNGERGPRGFPGTNGTDGINGINGTNGENEKNFEPIAPTTSVATKNKRWWQTKWFKVVIPIVLGGTGLGIYEANKKDNPAPSVIIIRPNP